MSRGRRTFLWSALNYLRSFLLFCYIHRHGSHLYISGVFLHRFPVRRGDTDLCTGCFFVNVLVLAAICVGIDALRRYVTVKRPARKIQGVLGG